MDRDAQKLLDSIMAEIRGISEEEHRLRRRRNILSAAATKLRTGKAAGLVEAELEHELPQQSNIVVLNRSLDR